LEVVTGAAEAAQQYFHTYRIPPNRQQIALREYDLSVQSLSGDQRSIALATGLTVVSVGFIGSVVGSDNGLKTVSDFLEEANPLLEWGCYLGLTAVALIALRYFAELQRSATHAARKIVVLRRLLGVDYGNIEKVMPTGALEGANEPFALPMFPGWGAISSLAALLVAPFTAALLLLLFGFFVGIPTSLSSEILLAFPTRAWAEASIFFGYSALLLLAFRLWLLEKWEDKRCILGTIFGSALNCPLKDRLGHVLYRMELAVFEARRVGIDLQRFHKFVVQIEDRRFYRHNGNDWIAVLRAVSQRLRYGFVSGGSTIDQQLFRSTCLRKIERRWTRKAIEWLMAPWLDARYEKSYILDMYLCSARFDRGVIGIAAAVQHFFKVGLHSSSKWLASPAQIIFLIERLSNISQTIPVKRVRAIVDSLWREQLITDTDVFELEQLYIAMITDGLTKGSAEEIDFRVPSRRSSQDLGSVD
jgi:penicillin-binding protein 1A